MTKPNKYNQELNQTKMKTQETLKILTEHSKWRRGIKPYNKPGTMPYSATIYGEALDDAIEKLKKLVTEETGLSPLRVRLIRCITPNAKCEYKRDVAENRAWDKVKGWVLEEHVKIIEEFYKADKSEAADETWRRKYGVAALFNQLREQIDLGENYLEKNKPKIERHKEPQGWIETALSLANDPECPPNLRKELILAKSWSKIPSHLQSIILEGRLSK